MYFYKIVAGTWIACRVWPSIGMRALKVVHRPSLAVHHLLFAMSCDWIYICCSNCIFYCCHKLCVALKASLRTATAMSNNSGGKRQLNIRRKSISHQMRDCPMPQCPGWSLVTRRHRVVGWPSTHIDSCQWGLMPETSAAAA